MEQIAPRRQGILPRDHPSADEQVQLPIAVVVRRHERRPTGGDPEQRVGREREPAVAVVHVQPRLEGPRVGRDEAAAAHHQQVVVAVPVGIEEERAHVLPVLPTGPAGEDAPLEAAGRDLQVDGLLVPPIGPDVDILPPVAVHVAHRESRAALGERMRQEGRDLEIGDDACLVPEREPVAGRHGPEETRVRGLRRRREARLRVPVIDRQHLVSRHMTQHVTGAVRPVNHGRVNRAQRSQAEVEEGLDRGQVTARGVELEVLARRARVNGHLRSVSVAVSGRSAEREPEEVVARQPLGFVLENERGSVEVVDHEIQVTVVVEVGVRRPGGVARHVQPPRLRAIAERQVSVVLEDVVGELAARPLAKPLEQSLLALPLETLAAGRRQVGRAHLLHEGEIVEVGDVARIAVGDE